MLFIYKKKNHPDTLFRVGDIKAELAQQIRSDFEEAFQGAGAKVWRYKLLFQYRSVIHQVLVVGYVDQ